MGLRKQSYECKCAAFLQTLSWASLRFTMQGSSTRTNLPFRTLPWPCEPALVCGKFASNFSCGLTYKFLLARISGSINSQNLAKFRPLSLVPIATSPPKLTHGISTSHCSMQPVGELALGPHEDHHLGRLLESILEASRPSRGCSPLVGRKMKEHT